MASGHTRPRRAIGLADTRAFLYGDSLYPCTGKKYNPKD